jgi:hypothetical protein
MICNVCVLAKVKGEHLKEEVSEKLGVIFKNF